MSTPVKNSIIVLGEEWVWGRQAALKTGGNDREKMRVKRKCKETREERGAMS